MLFKLLETYLATKHPLKKNQIRLNGATAYGFLNKWLSSANKAINMLCLHNLFTPYTSLSYWEDRQRTAHHFPVSLFLLQKPTLSSAIKFLNAFSLFLLKKQRTMIWTLKTICCGVTHIFFWQFSSSVVEPSLHLSYFKLNGEMRMSSWAKAHRIRGVLGQNLTIWQMISFLSFSFSILLNDCLLWIISCMARIISYAALYSTYL